MILLKSLAIFFSYMLFPNSPFYDTYFTSKTLFIKPFSLLKVSSKVTCKKCQLSIFSPSPDLSHSVPQAQASHSKQHQSQFIPFTQQCHCFVTPEIPPQNPWFLRARDGLKPGSGQEGRILWPQPFTGGVFPHQIRSLPMAYVTPSHSSHLCMAFSDL